MTVRKAFLLREGTVGSANDCVAARGVASMPQLPPATAHCLIKGLLILAAPVGRGYEHIMYSEAPR